MAWEMIVNMNVLFDSASPVNFSKKSVAREQTKIPEPKNLLSGQTD